MINNDAMQDDKIINLPKVTVITVCFNAREALEMTMNNVARQDYPNLEYVIVDGGSTDGSIELIRNNADKVGRYVSEKDRGIYDAMNKGVAMSGGEWVIFMNAGDCFATDDVLRRVFSSPVDADVIYGDVVKGDRVCRPHEFKNSHRMCFCHQSSITRRRCLSDNPFDIKYRMSADFKFFKLMGKLGKKFVYVPLAISRFDTSGISNTSRSKGLLENIRIVAETDGFIDRMRLLPRLYFVYLMCKLRNK